jgi:RNA polymerase sigma-70 factor (ECF subfamily)
VELAAGDESSPMAKEALEQLCGGYWFPLYAYVRRQGFPTPEAQDLTQGFFHQLIAREFLKDVNPDKGRFRSFLLAAMKHFILNHRKFNARLKRGGEQVTVSFDANEAEVRLLSDSRADASAERAFDRRWAMTVMELALRRLQAEHDEAGRPDLYPVLKKFLSVEPAGGEYEQIASDVGLSRNAVSVAVHRLRRRFGELIRDEIKNTVTQPLEVENEMRYLLELLTGP